MIITVLTVGSPTPVPGKKYSEIEIAYKDGEGKVQGKKLRSFASPTVFNTVKGLVGGDKAEVTVTKEGEFWNWTAIRKLGEGEAPAASEGKASTKDFAQQSANRYETAEERAARQRLIVRQSSLTAALATLTVGAKSVDKEAVKALADEYTAWVFEVKHDDGSVEALEDDIPY